MVNIKATSDLIASIQLNIPIDTIQEAVISNVGTADISKNTPILFMIIMIINS
tara:strand:- start:423 stop:581 length:159 start_codon:yes stop_codon:yes gene_type:complete